MCSRRGVRADRGAAGLANGDGGMVMRGDSGRFEEALERFDAVLLWDAFESYEVLRERAGCELGGGLMDGFSDPESTGLSKTSRRS